MADDRSPMSDLDAMLREHGCPYAAGTIDSVIWLHGYQAGLTSARDVVRLAQQASLGGNVVPLKRKP